MLSIEHRASEHVASSLLHSALPASHCFDSTPACRQSQRRQCAAAMSLEHCLALHPHLQLQQDAVQGRRLVVKQALPAGFVLFSSDPIIAVPTTTSTSLCFLCFPNTLHPASQHHLCPLSHIHDACRLPALLSSLQLIAEQSRTPQPKLLLLVKTLILSQLLPSSSPSLLPALFELSANTDAASARYARYAAVVDLLLPLLPLPAAVTAALPRERLIHLVAAFNTNSHRMRWRSADGLQETEGEAVSLLLSMMEHSCCPTAEFNTVVASDGGSCSPSMQVSSLVPLAAGSAISISYHPARTRTALRRRHLLQHYGFVCQCSDCSGHDVRRRFSVKHRAAEEGGEDDCDGLVSMRGSEGGREQWRCERCAWPVSEEQYRSCLELERTAMRAHSSRKKLDGKEESDVSADRPEASECETPLAADRNGSVSMHRSHYLFSRWGNSS